MSEQMIRPGDIFKIIWGYRKSMLLIFVLTAALVMGVYKVLPRSYQSETVIHISGSYFQNPLLGDLVSQIYDPSEVREERGKIIKASLGEKFAEAADAKYHLFKMESGDPDRSPEVESFLKGIDVFSITPTQFKIKLKAPTAEAADGLIHDAINSVRDQMYQRRTKMLQDLLDVLSTEITHTASDDTLPSIGGETKSKPLTATEAGRAQIMMRIDGLNARLADLRTSYNDQHPAIQKLKAEIARLHAQAQGKVFSESRHGSAKSESDRMEQNATKDELTRRRHLVNVSFEMEKKDPTMSAYLSVIEEPKYPKTPSFPKKRVFAIVAFIAGLFAALARPALGEYLKRMPVDPRDLGQSLGAGVLGAISLSGLQKSQSDSGTT